MGWPTCVIDRIGTHLIFQILWLLGVKCQLCAAIQHFTLDIIS